jgi:glyoxylase-like metal-dependent hydrolase (beta-lactamase superfamily II)
VGTRRTILLDAGSSAAHTRAFLEELATAGVPPPSLVVLTHSHWDHVFGAAELGVPVVAHRRTAEYLDELARTDWSDEALDRRLAAGEVSQFHVDNVRQELPAPRNVRVAPADVVFDDAVTFDLGGGVRVLARHLPNDHSDDGCVAFVEPDRVLFVGDATYDSPDGVLTTDKALPLLDSLVAFRPEHVVTGHEERVETLAELEQLRRKVRLAAELAAAGEPGDELDEEMRDFVRAFAAGAGQA